MVPQRRMANPPQDKFEMNCRQPWNFAPGYDGACGVLQRWPWGRVCHRNGEEPAQVRYGARDAGRKKITRYVTASGSLSAVVSVDVGSQISGTISVLNADFNSPVC